MVSVRQSAHSRMIGRRWSKKLPVRYARLISTYAPHQPPPGHRITHAGHVQHGAFGRHQAAPTIQPPTKTFDTGPWPSPSIFRPRYFRNYRPRLFTVADVVGPDLRQGEFPSLQLSTQPFLHRLGAQRNSPTGLGHVQPMQDGVGVRQAFGVSTHHPVIGAHPAGQRDPQANDCQQRVPQPTRSWLFQVPNGSHPSRAPQAIGQLTRHPLAEHIR